MAQLCTQSSKFTYAYYYKHYICSCMSAYAGATSHMQMRISALNIFATHMTLLRVYAYMSVHLHLEITETCVLAHISSLFEAWWSTLRQTLGKQARAHTNTHQQLMPTVSGNSYKMLRNLDERDGSATIGKYCAYNAQQKLIET